MNNRTNTKAIWSERQVAIYYQLDLANTASTWIVFQASQGMKNGIKEYLDTAAGQDHSLINHFGLHVFFLLELAGKWRDYINFLECQLVELVSHHLREIRVTELTYNRMRKL